MKNKIFILSSLLLLLVNTVVCAQQSNLSFKPEHPMPGQTIAVTYDAATTNLAGKKNITCVAYTFRNFNWEAIDLKLIPEGTVWKGTIVSPKDCGIIAFKFVSGDTTDNNNDRAYVCMLAGDHNTMAPVAYAGWGLLRSPRYGYTIPGYLKKGAVSDTVTYYWLNREIQTHPEISKERLAASYAIAINRAGISNAADQTQKALQFLLAKPDASEENLLQARSILTDITKNNKNEAAVDSLDKVILKRFPKGELFKQKSFQAIYSVNDIAQKASLINQFLKDFPYQQSNFQTDEKYKISYVKLYQDLMLISISKHDYNTINTYISSCPFGALTTIYYRAIQIPYDKLKTESADKLYPYANAIIERMQSFSTTKPTESWFYSPLEWVEKYQKLCYSSFITQVNLLKNAGKVKEAMALADYTQKLTRYGSSALNDDYVDLLEKTGRKNEVLPAMEASVRMNQATTDILNKLQATYLKKNKSTNGFDNYIKSLKDKNNYALMQNEIKSKMVKQQLDGFAMLDANSKMITLEANKGKTVILDFWAIWCAPCKASFAGMKLAVDKYKNDPNVVFYFVDTQEHTIGYQEAAKKYIADNNLPFQILFDVTKDGSKINDKYYESMTKSLRISGIPLKMIIDKNGYLRFFAVGYNGSPSALADEISTMIELTKNSN